MKIEIQIGSELVDGANIARSILTVRNAVIEFL
jgi:hypothetical protein